MYTYVRFFKGLESALGRKDEEDVAEEGQSEGPQCLRDSKGLERSLQGQPAIVSVVLARTNI